MDASAPANVLMASLPAVPRVAASAGGALLALSTQTVAALRPARKPLHPDGDIVTGRIYRNGSEEKTASRGSTNRTRTTSSYAFHVRSGCPTASTSANGTRTYSAWPPS
jgi:hypothetical protein